MKKAFQKIVSVSMAFLLLLSTVLWTVDKHLCMGRVMDIAFFVGAKDCGMEVASNLMGEDFQNHCCDDESFTVQGQDDLKLSWNDIELEQQSFIIAFIYSYNQLFSGVDKELVPHEQYPPPLLVKDIQLFDQIFLI